MKSITLEKSGLIFSTTSMRRSFPNSDGQLLPRRILPVRPGTSSISTSSSTRWPCSLATLPVWLRICLFAGVPADEVLIVLTARNAWIQADANRFGGANTCTLWRAFASRGLGVNAANHVDDSTVPSGC